MWPLLRCLSHSRPHKIIFHDGHPVSLGNHSGINSCCVLVNTIQQYKFDPKQSFTSFCVALEEGKQTVNHGYIRNIEKLPGGFGGAVMGFLRCHITVLCLHYTTRPVHRSQHSYLGIMLAIYRLWQNCQNCIAFV